MAYGLRECGKTYIVEGFAHDLVVNVLEASPRLLNSIFFRE